MTPEAHPNMEAIYFLEAVPDPLKILEKLETELNTTIVASNPAMLWFILSELGLRYQIRGHGQLLEQWPRLAD